MSTNYYLKRALVCPHCHTLVGRHFFGTDSDSEEGLHIGKRNAGWAFALHVYPDGQASIPGDVVGFSINDLADWLPLFVKYGIVDEYGRDVTPAELIEEITVDARPLRRHKPEANRCLGPGTRPDGSIAPWDLMLGSFS